MENMFENSQFDKSYKTSVENKAQEIARSYPMPPSTITVSDAVAMIENGALQMSDWKDKEFEYILNIAFETIGEQNGHCSEDLFEYLDTVQKLLKDSDNQ